MKHSTDMAPNLIQFPCKVLNTFSRKTKDIAAGKMGTPVCMGHTWAGKNSDRQDYAKQKNWKLAYCALHNLRNGGPAWHAYGRGPDSDRQTAGMSELFCPDWVPKDDGPGILLLDDVNRADDRMLRGIMQLL